MCVKIQIEPETIIIHVLYYTREIFLFSLLTVWNMGKIIVMVEAHFIVLIHINVESRGTSHENHLNVCTYPQDVDAHQLVDL
jgi:hypothetical protein